MTNIVRFTIRTKYSRGPLPVKPDQIMVVESVRRASDSADVRVEARILENTFVCPLCHETCENLLLHRCKP